MVKQGGGMRLWGRIRPLVVQPGRAANGLAPATFVSCTNPREAEGCPSAPRVWVGR
jgi:hypothetical protein